AAARLLVLAFAGGDARAAFVADRPEQAAGGGRGLQIGEQAAAAGATTLLVMRETGAGRDEASHDHVLLEPAELVARAAHRSLGEHARGLLERGRRDERLGRQRRLGDAEQLAVVLRRTIVLVLALVLLVLGQHVEDLRLLALQELRVT